MRTLHLSKLSQTIAPGATRLPSCKLRWMKRPPSYREKQPTSAQVVRRVSFFRIQKAGFSFCGRAFQYSDLSRLSSATLYKTSQSQQPPLDLNTARTSSTSSESIPRSRRTSIDLSKEWPHLARSINGSIGLNKSSRREKKRSFSRTPSTFEEIASMNSAWESESSVCADDPSSARSFQFLSRPLSAFVTPPTAQASSCSRPLRRPHADRSGDPSTHLAAIA